MKLKWVLLYLKYGRYMMPAVGVIVLLAAAYFSGAADNAATKCDHPISP